MRHRYAKLGSFALKVSDPSSAVFYESLWGLQPNGREGDGPPCFRYGDHHSVILFKGELGPGRIAWQMEGERTVYLLLEVPQLSAVSAHETDLAE
jgi:hypothetical protein